LEVVDTVQAVTGALVNVALWPGGMLPATFEWVWAALLSGAALTMLWRRLQSPQRVQRVLSRAWSGLLAVWLFRHEPRAAARAQMRALGANLTLLFWLLLPMAISIAVAAPFLLQLQPRFGYRPLSPGDSIVAHFVCVDAAAAARLQVDWPGAGGAVEVLVHEPATAAVVTRLAAAQAGRHQLRVTTGGPTMYVPVSVALPPAAAVFDGGQLPEGSGLVRVTLAYAPVSWRWWLLFGCVSCLGAAAVWGLPRVGAIFRNPRDRTVPLGVR